MPKIQISYHIIISHNIYIDRYEKSQGIFRHRHYAGSNVMVHCHVL